MKIPDYLYSLQSRGINPGLERIKTLANLIGDPQNEFESVIVGGTNGKGSVVCFLNSILNNAGIKSGSYYSPHVESFNERISINGKPIDDSELADLTDLLKEKVDTYNKKSKGKHELKPTFFEFATAIAFARFFKNKIDLALLEVGLGGRFDAVNIVHPLLSIITNVSIDHTEYLGNTKENIAFEKAGIINERKPVITGEKDPGILKFLQKTAAERGSELFILGKDFKASTNPDGTFNYHGTSFNIKDIRKTLSGDHQIENACLAIAACEVLNKLCGYNITERNILDGLAGAYIPGRLEYFEGLPFRILFDVAHNAGGSTVLANYLRKTFEPADLVLMVGIMKDKNYEEMIANYINLASKIILVRPDYERAWTVAEMENLKKKAPDKIMVIPKLESALRHCFENLNRNQTLCITGSVFTVGEARALVIDSDE